MKKLLILLVFLPSFAAAFMADDEIAVLQRTTAGWSTGERIAFWAEQFIALPYDPDPLGEYVRKNVVVADERVDCMYHVFRSVELALGKDPADSITVALDKRFHGKGLLKDGRVSNYTERFRYGEDMIESGKWGREITAELGETVMIKGERGRKRVAMRRKQEIPKALGRLQSGDLVFFVKDPKKRISREIVGHIGIIKVEAEKTYLVSAFGRKNRGGTVGKILLSEYGREMPFVGIKVSRLE
ncbi:MAG: hypothetical protein HZB31_06355 [Nitrospirae bacterium]|nr:hypothetical protein [Nitrospirota bacterium]